jgi:hypothetical protein
MIWMPGCFSFLACVNTEMKGFFGKPASFEGRSTDWLDVWRTNEITHPSGLQDRIGTYLAKAALRGLASRFKQLSIKPRYFPT